MEKIGKVIEFDGTDFVIMDEFTYKDKEYLYVLEDTENDNKSYNFLRLREDGMYETPENEAEFDEIMEQQSKRIFG